MYIYYRLLTLTLNTSGGSAETIEKMTKEVKDDEGKVTVVPCTYEESLIKFYNKLSSVGGNKATQSIKCMLFDDKGGLIKVDEIVKPTVTE